MDDDDEFYDTLSLASQYSSAAKRKFSNKDYMSLSRNTIYHSAYDLDMDMINLDPTGNRHTKVSKYPKAVTYREWRDRVLFIETKSTKIPKRTKTNNTIFFIWTQSITLYVLYFYCFYFQY